MSKYLETVARSGQVNTPPGSYQTVREWAQQSFIGPHSRLLEVGCSTGFISIEIARYTGASTVGIDLHTESVETARTNVDPFVKGRVRFRQGDAGKLPFEENTFSHVVISGHLPFVPPELRINHIQEAFRTLQPWGHLLVALYYYNSAPPVELVERFNARVGTRLSPNYDRSYWSGLFDEVSVTLEYEQDYEVIPGSKQRIETYITQMKADTQSDWRTTLKLFNENGRYLSYFVRVYRKVPSLPNLMIQVPRGGIYEVRKKQK